MLDIGFIRENQAKVTLNAKNKGIDIDIDELLKVDDERRVVIRKVEELRAQRNTISSSSKEKPSPEQIAKGKEIKTELVELEVKMKDSEEKFMTLLKKVPNMATDDTPVGTSEADNQVVLEWGEKPDFNFKPQSHWELAGERGWIDKERAAKVTGARFAYILGPLVQLQMAIINYTLEQLVNPKVLKTIFASAKLDLTDKPFTPVLPPSMLRTEVFDAMDRLEPREDRYKIEGSELWLQGSAEHVLGSMYMNEIIDEADLPLRFVGYATSFRQEAGTYGKEMDGIIRMHQFDKLEMEIFADPKSGINEHLLTIAVQEYLMRQLGLPYRKLLKCTADIGKPNARGVDIDVWLPAKGYYKETHTADFMADYQSRRLGTKLRRKDGTLEYVYTIDATAFAMGRLLAAIIENYQTKDGHVIVPKVIRPYFGGRKQI